MKEDQRKKEKEIGEDIKGLGKVLEEMVASGFSKILLVKEAGIAQSSWSRTKDGTKNGTWYGTGISMAKL